MGWLGDYWRFLNEPQLQEHDGPASRYACCGREHPVHEVDSMAGVSAPRLHEWQRALPKH